MTTWLLGTPNSQVRDRTTYETPKSQQKKLSMRRGTELTAEDTSGVKPRRETTRLSLPLTSTHTHTQLRTSRKSAPRRRRIEPYLSIKKFYRG